VLDELANEICAQKGSHRLPAFYASHGIVTKRVMTDNAFTYVMNRTLRELLAARAIAHLKTKPYAHLSISVAALVRGRACTGPRASHSASGFRSRQRAA
jgi:hypothetical protein